MSYSPLTVDLGNEPAIPARNAGIAHTQQKLNRRWLLATALTGIIGAILMGLAASTTLRRHDGTTSPPDIVKQSQSEISSSDGALIIAKKSDFLSRRADVVSARQNYKVSIPVRNGDAEVMRLASFTRVSGPLSLETLGFADQVKSFDPGRLMAESSEERYQEALAPSIDSDINLQSRALEEASLTNLSDISILDDAARTQVQEILTAPRRNAPSLPAQMLLAKAMRSPAEVTQTLSPYANPALSPFSRLVVRMVTENVTTAPKRTAAEARNRIEEHVLLLKGDEGWEALLRPLQVSADEARRLYRQFASATQIAGQPRRMRLVFQSLEEGAPRALVRADLYQDETLVAAIGRRDDGSFSIIEAKKTVPVKRVAPAPAKDDEEDTDSEAEAEGGYSLYNSLNETARRHNVPLPIIDDMVRVLFFDVDLQRRVNPGDSFEILYADDPQDAGRNDLMLISLTVGGETRKFYRFRLNEDDLIDYFDDQGRSAKKFLLRKPISGGTFRSGFGLRRHPILRYARMHNGVDWADRIGTPILASGNGNIRSAAWDSGYGRRVEIEHSNGYVSTYSHMSGFARGITPGAKVRQGQVIGYLGSSGLSTGPHLHYEVLVNDNYVDPLGIKLPKGRELDGKQLTDFKRERERTDDILKKAPGIIGRTAQK